MRRIFSIALAVIFTFCATTSFAAPSFKDRQEAKKLAVAAAKLAKKGKFKKAARKYKKANRLVPAASYMLAMAKAYIELEDLVKAGEVLREAADLKPRGWAQKKAQKECKKLLASVEEDTPTLTIEVASPSATEVTIIVDEEEIESADGAVAYNPGKYEIVATAEGYEQWAKKVELEEGDEKTISITMKATSASVDEGKDSGSSDLGRIPAYAAWGVGAVGLALGVGFGIAAISATNEVLTLYNCQDGKCPPEAEDDLNIAKANGNVSTAGWVIAGVGAIAGTVLFLMSDDDGGDEKEGIDKEGDGSLLRIEAKPMVGPGYVGVMGTF